MRIEVTWETDSADVVLPTFVTIPDDVDDDDVAEWLSEKYGWLVEGWMRA